MAIRRTGRDVQQLGGLGVAESDEVAKLHELGLDGMFLGQSVLVCASFLRSDFMDGQAARRLEVMMCTLPKHSIERINLWTKTN